MPIAEDIIATHADQGEFRPGDLVNVRIDHVYIQDGNSPTIAKLFAKYGFDTVFDGERIGVFFDHSVITPSREIADRLKEAYDFARKQGLNIYRQGAGISHVVALEDNWFKPGTIVLGSDSHTCTGGVVQCLALGMGASDITAAMVTGRTWLRVPDTVWLNVIGGPSAWARSKDVALYMLFRFGQEPFLYKSVEWAGTWPRSLSLDSAATVASLGVELGAKCVFLPNGKGRPAGMRKIAPPKDAKNVLSVDITGLPPMIAMPHSPSNLVPLDELKGQRIDYVFVGSCTNSRLEDIAEVARILDGNQVHSGVHCLVTPGSQRVYLEALKQGYIESIAKSGAIVTPPGCGACLGTQGSIPAAGDRVLSTMNRNFLGRMGNPQSEIYLSSPIVAAHTAIRGEIPTLRQLQ